MIENSLTNITADSISGLIFGFEGVKNSIVLLNGPTGCKFYHSATSDNQMIRQAEFDPLEFPELWYFGQPRVPSTYLDKRDYVYGSEEKISDAINFLKKEVNFELLVIVNSPGASLIGDDLERIAQSAIDSEKIITIDSPGYSLPLWTGYSKACVTLIEKFSYKNAKPREAKKQSPCVNILGSSIYQRDFSGDLQELENNLKLCGIEISCKLCSGSSINEIKNLGNADLNIVLDSLYGLDSAKLLEAKFSTPYICNDGLLIGFSAMEELISEVCDRLVTDNGKFGELSQKARAKSYAYLSRVHTLTGLPKGVKFAVHGNLSQCIGYTRFLAKYFGMHADSISAIDITQNDAEQKLALKNLAKELSFEDALDKYILDTDAQIVFADGQTLAMLKAKHKSFSGIEISLPSLGYIDVIEKTHLGISGGLLLCEQILNGMSY